MTIKDLIIKSRTKAGSFQCICNEGFEGSGTVCKANFAKLIVISEVHVAGLETNRSIIYE